ncbi:MAG TPA: hypothetical protein VGI20_08180 [Rhizomicrobium sp.]|jgi:hypothetical protein
MNWKYLKVMVGLASLGLVLMAGTPISSAGDEPAPIRQFDIPTTQRLARAMYQQDQEAWKATDVLMAQHTETDLKAEKLHGWIVENIQGVDTSSLCPRRCERSRDSL